jgi:hypothetical protein
MWCIHGSSDIFDELKSSSNIVILTRLLLATIFGGLCWNSSVVVPFPLGERRSDLFIELVKLSHQLNIFNQLNDFGELPADPTSSECKSLYELLGDTLLSVAANSDPSADSENCRIHAFQLLMLTPSSTPWIQRCDNHAGFIPATMTTLFTILLESEDDSVDSDKITARLSPLLVRTVSA